MVLDAGASLASFIFSVLGWYASLRTGIQLVYHDYHDAKSLDTDMNGIIISIMRHEDELKEFKDTWMATSDTVPEGLYLYFWGKSRYNRIKEALLGIHRMMCELDAKVKPYLDLIARYELLGLPHTRKSIPGFRIWMKRQAIRAGFIGMRKARCTKLIEDVTRSLNNIKHMSEFAWRENHPGHSVDSISVRCRGICHLLVPLIISASNEIDDLRQSIQSPTPGHIMEVTLDIFGASANHHQPHAAGRRRGEPMPYPDKVSKAANRSHVGFGILTNNFSNGQSPEYFVQVRALADEEDCPAQVVTAQDAFQRVIQEQLQRVRIAFQTQQNRRFEVAELDTDNPPRGPRNCVWVLSPTQGIQFSPSDWGMEFQYKLAFELAQACFLFLNSSWFSKLCSCALHYSGGQNDQPIDFGLRIKAQDAGNYEAHTQHQAHTFDATPNGARESATRSLRHLGLLLIELKHEKLIRQVTADNSWTITEVGFINEAAMLPLREVLLTDRFEAGYHKALKYCMNRVINEHEMVDPVQREKMLKELYGKVVQP